jgi:hypothetical protein
MNNNKLLQFFRGIGLVFFIAVSVLILYWTYYHQYELVIKLLVPLGVLISALIASYSIMVSIDNAKNIENEKQKKELVNEIDMLKLKTSILKHSLSIYFADKKHYKEALKKSNISDDCMHSRDMSDELIDKLDNYEQFIDAKIKILLSKKDIFEILKEIIQDITIVRAEEKFKKEPPQKGFTITAQVDEALIMSLKNLEEYLDHLLVTPQRDATR